MESLGTISLGVSTAEADKNVNAFAARLDELEQKITAPIEAGLSLDTAKKELTAFESFYTKATKGIGEAMTRAGDVGSKGLAASFDAATRASGDLYDTQRKALAAIIASGGEGTEAYKSLVAEIQQTAKEAKAAEEALLKADQAAGRVSLATPNAQEPAAAGPKPAESGGFSESFFKGEALNKAGEFLSSFEEKSAGVREAWNAIQARTGASADEMATLRDQADSVFTSVRGITLDETIKSIGVAKQQLGGLFDSKGLESFTKRAAVLQQGFEVEATETIEKSRTAIKAWGLNGEQAADLVTLGLQKATTPANDFLDTLAEYSPLMKSAGFSAEEFTGTLIKGAENGAFSLDKVADAAKETQIRLKAGDISTALQGISGPVTATIQGIVKAGEAGTLSTKEVLQQSSAAIEKAFDAGQITDAMRSKLQIAISGTPAEDLGSDLYARIFSAKIDTDQIKSQAAAAGAQIDAAFGNLNPFEELQKAGELALTTISAKFAPVIAGAGGVLTTVGQIAPAFSLVKDTFFKSGEAAVKMGAETVTAAEGSAGAFGGLGAAGKAAWAAITGPVGLVVLALTAVTAAAVYFFTQTEKGKEIATTVFAYISSFVSHAGEIFSALGDVIAAYLNPKNWFTDDGATAREEARKRMSAAVEGAITGAKEKISISGVGKAIQDAVSIKEGIDKNNELGKLVDQYNRTTNEVEKSNLAQKIAKQVPSAITGTRQVIDETGKLKTVFEVNGQEAEKFYQAQAKTYDKRLSGPRDEYVAGLKDQVTQLHRNRDALGEMGKKIVEARDHGKDVSGLQSAYEDLQKKVQGNVDAIKTTVSEGRKTGLITGDVNELGKKYHFAADEAAAVSDAIKEVDQQNKQAVQSAADLAAKYDAAAQGLATAIGNNPKAFIENRNEIAALRKELAGLASDSDPDGSLRAQKTARIKELQDQNAAFRTEAVTANKEKTKMEKELSSISLAWGLTKPPDPADFTGKYKELVKGLTDSGDKLRQAFIQDEAEKARDTALTNLRNALQGFKDAREAYAKDINDQAAKGTPLKLTIDKGHVLTSKKEILGALDALNAQLATAAQTYTFTVELPEITVKAKRVKLEQDTKDQADALKSRGDTLRDVASGITAKTVDDVDKVLSLQIEGIQKQTDAAVTALVDGDARILDMKARLLALQDTRAALPVDAAPEVRASIEAQTAALGEMIAKTAEKIRNESPAVQDAIRKGDEELNKITRDLSDKRSAIYTNSLEESARIFFTRLKEIEAQYQKDLADAAGDPAKIKAAEDKRGAAIDEARTDRLRREDKGYAALLDLFNGASSEYLRQLKADQAQQTNVQLEGLNERAKNSRSAFDQGLIDYRSYVDQMDEIDQQRSAAMKSHTSVWGDLLAAFNAGAGKAIQPFVDRQREALDDSIKGLRQGKKDYADVGLEIGETLALVGVQAAASGGDAKKAILGSAFDILDALVPVLSAQITALALATPISVATATTGGFVLAGVITAVLKGVVSAARAAAGFREGGYTGDGSTYDVAGPVHRREFVMPEPITSRYRPQFEGILRGADPRAVFGFDEPTGAAALRAGAVVERAERRTTVVVQVQDAPGETAVVAELRQQNAILAQQVSVLTENQRALVAIRERALMLQFIGERQEDATKEQTRTIKNSQPRYWPKGYGPHGRFG
jgi:hypothetical protein